MDLIVIGKGIDDTGSTELQSARQRFISSFPLDVKIIHALGQDLPSLIQTALAAVDELCLADGARVLFAKCAYLWLTAGTINRLDQALDEGVSVAFAYDSKHFNSDCPPDYFTVRGLERYSMRLALQPNQTVMPGAAWPQLALTTVRSIRAGCESVNGQWVTSAYVHDFSDYHQGLRLEVLHMIPVTIQRALDVGGGEGGFLNALKSHRGCETHLAEFSSASCEVASQSVDKVWPGDFMRAPIDIKFDCITFLDVLEHTAWPAQWLSRAVDLLEPGGCIVASIPNVGHWSVVLDLLEGRWDYAPAGIHCITHLRFFTRRGIEQLMSEAGLKIEKIEPIQATTPPWFNVSSMQEKLAVNIDSLSSISYLVRAKPIL